MPREARKKSRSGIYHIMLRGINRQVIFEDDEDKRIFLEKIKKYKAISKYEMYSYCLMDNHVHLLIKEVVEDISKIIQRISSSYVYWYNMKYERVGHLFQERFKSENVETTRYFLTVLRYIHQNPLKAGLVKDVFQSKWTSVNEYYKQADMVDVDYGLQLFSQDKTKAIQMYTNYMQEVNNDQCLDITVPVRRSDEEVRKMLTRLGISNSSVLQQMDKEDRNAVLGELRTVEGVSVRQIARITGISKSVVGRIRL